MIKALVALCLCAICPALSAQASLKTFTSSDGVFQFRYSQILIHCTPERGSWTPAEACSRCDDLSSSGSMVCFAYPRDKFKNKPAFGGAAFLVAKIKDATTEKACLAGEKWLVHSIENKEIHGIRFKVFDISDAWTSGSEGGEIYRTFHDSECYELGIQQVWVSTGGLDAGTFQEFTKRDERMVRLPLRQALDSFRFVN